MLQIFPRLWNLPENRTRISAEENYAESIDAFAKLAELRVLLLAIVNI
jgi:hypothetical protein